jgi:16S rRNA (adenine1518-N6/adenine1519-N6)-dimethyltransferase
MSPGAQRHPVLLNWRAVPRQRLGQHFLASAAWRERIARLVFGGAGLADPAAPTPELSSRRGHLWIEIGAGHGEMTSLLARQAGRLITIELDPKLLPRLREQTAGLANVEVVASDVLSLDFAKLTGADRFRVYGNLPYYITSPIVHRLLEHADRLEAAFLVVQLEVAARMAARPRTRDYGYFSAFTQFYSKPEILLRIPPGAFQPPPKVSSALVGLRLPGERSQLGIENEAGFLKFLKICFAQKRKTLRNNLRPLMPQERATTLLRDCGMSLNIRAEEMTLTQFAQIFTEVKRI